MATEPKNTANEPYELAGKILAMMEGDRAKARRLSGETYQWLCTVDPTWKPEAAAHPVKTAADVDARIAAIGAESRAKDTTIADLRANFAGLAERFGLPKSADLDSIHSAALRLVTDLDAARTEIANLTQDRDRLASEVIDLTQALRDRPVRSAPPPAPQSSAKPAETPKPAPAVSVAPAPRSVAPAAPTVKASPAKVHGADEPCPDGINPALWANPQMRAWIKAKRPSSNLEID